MKIIDQQCEEQQKYCIKLAQFDFESYLSWLRSSMSRNLSIRPILSLCISLRAVCRSSLLLSNFSTKRAISDCLVLVFFWIPAPFAILGSFSGGGFPSPSSAIWSSSLAWSGGSSGGSLLTWPLSMVYLGRVDARAPTKAWFLYQSTCEPLDPWYPLLALVQV